jgi:hypothetical protein
MGQTQLNGPCQLELVNLGCLLPYQKSSMEMSKCECKEEEDIEM